MSKFVAIGLGLTWVGLGLAGWSWQRAENAALARQLQGLQAEVDELRAQLEGSPGTRSDERPPQVLGLSRPSTSGRASSLAAASVTSPPDGAADGNSAQQRYRDRITEAHDPAIASVVAALDNEASPIQARVRELVRDEQAAMWQAYRERRDEAWERRTSERLSQLAAEANLSQAQVDAVYATMTVARDRIGAAFRSARENNDFDGAHDKAKQIRAETDAQACETLDGAQCEAYGRMREELAAERRRRHRRMLGPPPPPTSEARGNDPSDPAP